MERSGSPQDSPRESASSCTECRKRKSKCDRGSPRCGNCAKHRRGCSYARAVRSPLTRSTTRALTLCGYVTNLEQELARAQQLLRDSQSESQDDDRSSVIEIGDDTARQAALTSTAGVPAFPLATNGSASFVGHLVPGQNNTSQILTPLVAAFPQTPQRTTDRSHFSFETSPASGNFDWDERRNGDSDGMASLTNASTRGGYLGVASGAALLRLADSSSLQAPPDGAENDALGDELTQLSTPIPKAMYSSSQLEPFVDAYFQLFHISYPIVHEATFRAQFMEIIPRPKQKAWLVLLHIIAAIGAFTTAETASTIDIALFDATKARLSIDMLQTGNLMLVQALTLISNYVQKRNMPNSGYNYIGLAKRIAMGVGLHKEFPAWRSHPLMLEKRRRIWWALYVFDVGAIITFSRPLDLPRGGVEVNLPSNVHDANITANTIQIPDEANEVTLYTHVRCQSQFHLASEHIYARLLSTPLPDAKELLDLDDMHIAPFVANLPPYFDENVQQLPRYRLCHAILRWRYRNFRILMYRAFVVRHIMRRTDSLSGESGEQTQDQNDNTAIQRCLDAASQTVELITTYWTQERHSMMACWYGLYFLFQAVLIPVICLRNQPQSPQACQWRHQIREASRTIADMAPLNHAAARCHSTIMSLCGVYINPSPGNFNEPVQESPQTQLNGLYPFMWPLLEGGQEDAYDTIMQDSAFQGFMNQINGM